MIKLTFFSVCMAVIWSSVFIVLFCVVRRDRRFLDIISIPSVAVLCLICILRLIVSVEIHGAVVVPVKWLYNGIYKKLLTVVLCYRDQDIRILDVLVVLWIVGALFLMTHDLVNVIKMKRMVKALFPYKHERLQDIRKRAFGGDEDKIYIYKDSHAQEPVCCGIVKRYIILPDKEYDDKMLYYVLRHEYMHLKNGDIVIKHMINTLCAVYWWNPLVYMLRINFDHLFELRCDRNVIKYMDDPDKADYLETILEIYKEENNNTKIASSNLKERFENVKKYSDQKEYNKYIAVISLFFLYILSYSFILQSSYDPVFPMEEGEVFFTLEDPSQDVYLIKKTEGGYVLVVDGEEKIINENSAQKLINDGMEIKD